MCLFITVVVPKTARTEALAAVVEKHRLSFSACENPYVKPQLLPAEIYLNATSGYCDCGSPLFHRSTAPSPQAIARQISKMRKKKWSEAKIKKWLEATGPRPFDPNASGSDQRSVKEWATFFDEALRLQEVPYLALVGHWYYGGVSTEDFTLAGRVPHTVDDLREGRLGVLDEDVIHEFRLRAL